jgi:hypothetical protein
MPHIGNKRQPLFARDCIEGTAMLLSWRVLRPTRFELATCPYEEAALSEAELRAQHQHNLK